MTSGGSVPGEQWPDGAESGKRDASGSDTPTPPSGFSLSGATLGEQRHPGTEDATPPAGIGGLSGVVSDEDFGRAGPTVLGGEDPVTPREDAGDWPTLEYRRRANPERGGRDWLGRRRDRE
jgi:hypothetical protein